MFILNYRKSAIYSILSVILIHECGQTDRQTDMWLTDRVSSAKLKSQCTMASMYDSHYCIYSKYKMNPVVPHRPKLSVLWASPGTTSDPATLWEGNWVLWTSRPETRSRSMTPSLICIMTNIVGNVRGQFLKLPCLLGSCHGIQGVKRAIVCKLFPKKA